MNSKYQLFCFKKKYHPNKNINLFSFLKVRLARKFCVSWYTCIPECVFIILSVMTKLAVEPQNRTNILLWLCPGRNSCWESVFKKPWTVDQECEKNCFSRSVRERPSVSLSQVKPCVSLLLSSSVLVPFISKQIKGSSFAHCLLHVWIFQTKKKKKTQKTVIWSSTDGWHLNGLLMLPSWPDPWLI